MSVDPCLVGPGLLLKRGAAGEPVRQLQKALAIQGFDPGEIDGRFCASTEAALVSFQRSEQLAADGVAGLRTLTALRLEGRCQPAATVLCDVTVEEVSRVFPHTRISDISAHLPDILRALRCRRLDDRSMVLVALATIRSESESLLPPSEEVSRFNTSPSGRPFDLYDHRKDLGNLGHPDGAAYRGRGFVRLTGRLSYQTYGPKLSVPCNLEEHPSLACAIEVAADLLSLFLLKQESAIRALLAEDELHEIPRLISGRTAGSARFVQAFQLGDSWMPIVDDGGRVSRGTGSTS